MKTKQTKKTTPDNCKEVYKSTVGLTYFDCEQQDSFKQMSDHENPYFTFSCTTRYILVLIATGKIDARAMAWKELADRGYDVNGNYIGFKQAIKEFECNVTQCMKMD